MKYHMGVSKNRGTPKSSNFRKHPHQTSNPPRNLDLLALLPFEFVSTEVYQVGTLWWNLPLDHYLWAGEMRETELEIIKVGVKDLEV